MLVGDRVEVVNGQVPRDVIAVAAAGRRGRGRARGRAGRAASCTVEVAKRAGQPLGIEVHSALFDQVQHVRQPLRVLLHLPAAEGHAAEPVPEGRRLPAVVPLRQLHHAHPVHRGRPRAGHHRAAEPAEREHPRDRPGACGRGCCATGAAPRACAGSRALLDARHRGARPGRRVPGHQRRRRARRHAARRARPVSRARDAVRRAARREPLVDRAAMRPHTADEARRRGRHRRATGRSVFLGVLGRRLVFAADEYYLLADRPFPAADAYEGFPMHENGIGMARTFEAELHRPRRRGAPASRRASSLGRRRAGRGLPSRTAGRAAGGHGALLRRGATRRSRSSPASTARGCSRRSSTELGRDDVRVVPVANEFFGGNIGVTGLLVGADLAACSPTSPRSPLPAPDVCLSAGRFLDGTTPADLPRPVEVVATDGVALRAALGVR